VGEQRPVGKSRPLGGRRPSSQFYWCRGILALAFLPENEVGVGDVPTTHTTSVPPVNRTLHEIAAKEGRTRGFIQ
jgi:hypothetical protein